MADIKVKQCNLGCGKQIYWSVDDSYYIEFDTRERHFCPNYQKGQSKSSSKTADSGSSTVNNNGKKEKMKMESSVEIIKGTMQQSQKRYERLSDLINAVEGKIHGSQSHIFSMTDVAIAVYYEVPIGKREEIKSLFKVFDDQQ